MSGVSIAALAILTAIATVWVFVYGFMVVWWKSVYGQVLMLLMTSLWLTLVATLHDVTTDSDEQWGAAVGVPLSILMGGALVWSLTVMIRDNFAKGRGKKDEVCPDQEGCRRDAGGAGGVGADGER